VAKQDLWLLAYVALLLFGVLLVTVEATRASVLREQNLRTMERLLHGK
jgi:hypothetical protein